jgi:hypothetical protein
MASSFALMPKLESATTAVSDTSPSIPTLHKLMQFAIPLVKALQFFILKITDIIQRGKFQTSKTLGSEISNADLQTVATLAISFQSI